MGLSAQLEGQSPAVVGVGVVGNKMRAKMLGLERQEIRCKH